MNTIYREHEITVTREPSMMGDEMLFWSIFRESDGYECDSGYSEGSDMVEDFMEAMKRRVDAELAEENPWLEMEEQT